VIKVFSIFIVGMRGTRGSLLKLNAELEKNLLVFSKEEKGEGVSASQAKEDESVAESVASLTASVLRLSALKKQEELNSAQKSKKDSRRLVQLERDVAGIQLQFQSVQSQLTEVLNAVRRITPSANIPTRDHATHGDTKVLHTMQIQGKSVESEITSVANGERELVDDDEEEIEFDDASSVKSLVSGIGSFGQSPLIPLDQKRAEAGRCWFLSTYADDTKFKSHLRPLSPMDITRLKAAGILCNITVLFQLGVSRPSSRNGNEFLSATSCEFLCSIPNRLRLSADVMIGDSLTYAFPVNPEYLVAFLDASIADVNAGHQFVERRYRLNTSAKIAALTEYKQNILQLLHNLFGDANAYHANPSWIEYYGLVLCFHLFRWNKAILNNEFDRLNFQFLLEWEGLGFRARMENLPRNKQRLVEFQATVSMLNFFCRSCRRFGNLNHFCETAKCASQNQCVISAANSIQAWEEGFSKWKGTRGAKEAKSVDAYIKSTGKTRPVGKATADTWSIVLAAQNLIAPQGSPNLFNFTI
jgi:hypothetical protein